MWSVLHALVLLCGQEVDDDHASISSAGSARTFGSSRSAGGTKRPPSVARAAPTMSSGAVSEDDFTKSFEDAPSMNVRDSCSEVWWGAI